MSSLKGEVNHLKSTLQVTDKKREQLDTSLRSREKEFAKLERQHKQTVYKQKELEQNLSETSVMKDELDSEVKNNRKKIIELERITASKENELESVLQEFSFKDEMVTIHKNKLDLVAQSETQAKEDLNSARNQIRELENEIEGITEEKRLLQDDVDRSNSRIQHLETQLESSREERKRLHSQWILLTPS